MHEVVGAAEGAKMLEEGQRLQIAGEYEKALAIYDSLMSQNYDNAGMLATVGTMFMQMGKSGLGLSMLYRASQRSPGSGDILSNLGLAYKYCGHHEKAMECLEKAIKASDEPTKETLNTYAGFHVNVGQPHIAQEYAEKAIAKDHAYATAHWNLAMSLLELGQWDRAWDEQEWGYDAGMRVRRTILDRPQWDGTNGKTLHVYGEQGIGDEIMFASMLPDLMAAGNKVILECHPRLQTLFRKAWPDMPIFGTRTEPELDWPEAHPFDASVSIGSLGKWFRRSAESFPGTPYLKADPLPKGDKFRVGISWIGGRKPGRVVVRSIGLPWWEPILDVPNVEFVSLQYTDCEAELGVMKANGYDIKVIGDESGEYVKAEDYYKTAQLVASCDLVISIATSVYHLAGALGVPTWVLTPNKPAWREQASGRMPFYRSVRMYRQPKGNADMWKPVIAKVALDLRDRVNERQQERIAA